MRSSLITADAIEGVARRLCQGAPVLLPFVSVGRYTPAVRTSATPAFVVLNLQGAPLAFAHDAFEAALDALRLDGAEDLDREIREECVEVPRRRPTDGYLAAEACLARLQCDGWHKLAMADLWLRDLRGMPKGWTPLYKLAAGLTVEDIEARRIGGAQGIPQPQGC